MASVRFANVSKQFPGKSVLADVTFEVPDGELWVILGPSGSGKSTLLRLVAGLEEPTGGQIFLGERRVNGLSPRERDIAFVFQSYALYPHMTVYENIAFPLKVAGMSRARIDERVANVAALLGLSDLLARTPRALSGGQRQRVAIGRAVIREPQVFLFDEPLSNLDARLRASTRLELVALHRRLATTTLYVTHDQEEAMTLGQKVAIVHEGQLQQIGTPAQIYHQPANRFVAGFIGTPPMNFIEGRIESGRFVAEGLTLPAPPSLASGPMTLGIRSEQVHVRRGGTSVPPTTEERRGGTSVPPTTEERRGGTSVPPALPLTLSIRAEVLVVEDLGSIRYVHVTAGPHRLAIADRGPGEVRPGDGVDVTMDLAAAHWFRDDRREDARH